MAELWGYLVPRRNDCQRIDLISGRLQFGRSLWNDIVLPYCELDDIHFSILKMDRSVYLVALQRSNYLTTVLTSELPLFQNEYLRSHRYVVSELLPDMPMS
ncbi:hypothetical protein Hypma_016626 [Hypsizygus marmoreus]|uniref:Uncharacterized protein n=1 Tax=Hypsizygus marmoreus TaxID=39966 RepID=A0A369J4T3_HYPMA|nr:hypothetical protein Hypma_016626 [Hypsizygus marmoreus]